MLFDKNKKKYVQHTTEELKKKYHDLAYQELVIKQGNQQPEDWFDSFWEHACNTHAKNAYKNVKSNPEFNLPSLHVSSVILIAEIHLLLDLCEDGDEYYQYAVKNKITRSDMIAQLIERISNQNT